MSQEQDDNFISEEAKRDAKMKKLWEKKEKKRLKREAKIRKKMQGLNLENTKTPASNTTNRSSNNSLITPKVIKRVNREYQNAVKSDICDIVMKDENKIGEYLIRFTPKDGHYQGQTLIVQLSILFANGVYPFSPPHLKLLTPIWHTNISNTGTICVDFIYDRSKWIPTISFTTLIAQLQLLFIEPEISSGHYNIEATKMFRKALSTKDFTEYDAKCAEYYLLHPSRERIVSNFDRLYNNQHPNRRPVGI